MGTMAHPCARRGYRLEVFGEADGSHALLLGCPVGPALCHGVLAGAYILAHILACQPRAHEED